VTLSWGDQKYIKKYGDFIILCDFLENMGRMWEDLGIFGSS